MRGSRYEWGRQRDIGRWHESACEGGSEVWVCFDERTWNVWRCGRWQRKGRKQRWFEKSRAVVCVCRAQSTTSHGSGAGRADFPVRRSRQARGQADVAVLLVCQGGGVGVDHGSNGLTRGATIYRLSFRRGQTRYRYSMAIRARAERCLGTLPAITSSCSGRDAEAKNGPSSLWPGGRGARGKRVDGVVPAERERERECVRRVGRHDWAAGGSEASSTNDQKHWACEGSGMRRGRGAVMWCAVRGGGAKGPWTVHRGCRGTRAAQSAHATLPLRHRVVESRSRQTAAAAAALYLECRMA